MDVPEERLELSRDNSQRLLRPQRLPISPSGHYEAANIIFYTMLFNIIRKKSPWYIKALLKNRSLGYQYLI